ncbi:MAG: bifunctional adenosylcobinamide kinase/adenosylcobinamide-phosphate guanylyltransferase [Thermodesulfobacteriota bacterium]
MAEEPGHEVVLALGGARSGKSSWALRYVERNYRSRFFLATAEILDEEMAERVRLHRESRGPEWTLLEEPLDLPGALRARCPLADAVLVDCLTVWLSNVMLKEGRSRVPFYRDGLLKTLAARRTSVVLVSNEVGMGVVPEHPLGRAFRDEAGALNQAVAQSADRVVFLAAGLPLWLKGEDPDSARS